MGSSFSREILRNNQRNRDSAASNQQSSPQTRAGEPVLRTSQIRRANRQHTRSPYASSHHLEASRSGVSDIPSRIARALNSSRLNMIANRNNETRPPVQDSPMEQVETTPPQPSQIMLPSERIIILGVRSGSEPAEQTEQQQPNTTRVIQRWTVYLIAGNNASIPQQARNDRSASEPTLEESHASSGISGSDQAIQNGALFGLMMQSMLGFNPPGAGDYELFSRLGELLGPARPRQAQDKDVNEQLKTVQFDKIDTQSDINPSSLDKCAICLNEYQSDEELRVLTCKHAMHKTCLDNWLLKYVNSCPMCRTKAVESTASETAPTQDLPTQDLPIPTQDLPIQDLPTANALLTSLTESELVTHLIREAIQAREQARRNAASRGEQTRESDDSFIIVIN